MKNKEIIIVLCVLVVALILVFAFGSGDKNKSNKEEANSSEVDTILANAQKESETVKPNEIKEFSNIDVTAYLEYYAGEDTKLVLVARPTCHYCQIAEPILQNVAYKYDLNIHYLNTDDFSEDDDQKFIESDEFLADGVGTPLLMNVGNGKIIDKVDGLTDSEHYIQFFKDNGYIK